MMRTLGRLLRLAAPFGRWMALAVFLGFATIGSSVGLLATSAYLISKAALQPSIADLQVAIVGVRFFGISRGLFRYLERLVSHEVTFRLLARLRVWFYRELEPLAPARLLAYQSGDLLARIVADIGTLENLYLRVIAPPAIALLVALLAAILMGSFDPRLALMLLAFLFAAAVGLPLLTGALSRRTGQRMVSARSAMNSELVDGIQGIADLLAFGRGGGYLEKVRSLSHDLGNLQLRMASIGGFGNASIGLLMNLATIVVLIVAIPMISQGALDGVYLALLTMVVIASFEAVLPLPQAFQYLENSLEAGRRLFEIVDAKPAVTDPEVPTPLPDDAFLRVENLRFAYDQVDLPALDGLSFELPSGGTLAIVGPSGAGKSTLLRLLLRFWDYEDGEIWLDGQKLRACDQEAVRARIGVVSQHTYLFNATVRENLLLARPGATKAEMIQAARRAQIHEFILSLPDGYDTMIGEQGLRLSGGQRQRLAIARALVKDVPMLILDEPTANLDALTERSVLGSLREAAKGRTVLTVTHRIVGLEAADEILVLGGGRIVERGRHHELLQMEGLYHRMWNSQRQVLARQ